MQRRDFIKISSVLTAGSTILTSCGKGMREAMPVMVPEDQLVLGEEKWVKSVCGGCGAACGVEVRLVDGRAVKLEGQAAHPINAGRLCARGQAELQALYNPDRIRAPRRGGQEATWEEALEAVAETLREALAEPQRIVLVTRRLNGLRGRLIGEFLRALGGASHLVAEPLDEAAILEANRLTCGYASHAAPDFGNANYVLSFSAPLVEAGPSPVRTQRLLAHMRQGRPGRRGKLVQTDARFSLTAAYADEWLPLRPGTEGALALAIAHVLLRDSLVDQEFLSRHAQGLDHFRQIVAAYSPKAVAASIGLDAGGLKPERIERVAHEFAAHQPAVAVAGGSAAGHSNSLPALVAINALNALVGSYGVPGGVWFAPAESAPAAPTLASGDGQALLSSARVVLVYGANPVYEFPALPWGKIPFLISLSAFPDETAERAHVVLPDHTALERWESREAAGGPIGVVRSVARPALAPLYDTQDAADSLLALAARVGKPLPYENWEDAVAASFASEEELPDALERGGAWATVSSGNEEPAPFTFGTPSKKYEFVPRSESGSESDPESDEVPPGFEAPRWVGEPNGLVLEVYAGVSLGTGDGANLPWLQELPDPLAQTVWTTAAELNPKTADQLGVAHGERIRLESPQGKIEARAAVSPAAPPNAVVLAAGQGHTAYGRYARHRGANVFALLDPAAWAGTRVKVSKV